MKYDQWLYLYPPRAEHVITADMMPFYQKRGWAYQYKKNGTCTTITIDPKGDVKFMTRHATGHKAWMCPDWLKLALLDRVPSNRWTMLVAELLHNKTKEIKDTLYIYDVIVYQNTHLIGTTLKERLNILDGIIPAVGTEQYSHWDLPIKSILIADSKVIELSGIWRAKTLIDNPTDAFQGIKNKDIDEGLVLKDLNAKLQWCNKEKNNDSWQVKVRYPTKKYTF